MNKKAAFDFWSDWAEFFFFILLFIGFIIGIFSHSAVITYLVSFTSGMMAGRLFYDKKDKGRAPFFLIIIGFLMGYVLGTFYGDKRITILLFIVGSIICYQLYAKKIIKDSFI